MGVVTGSYRYTTLSDTTFGYSKKRKVTTAVSDQKKPVFPDLVGRKFTADKPNRTYVGDITYLLTDRGRVEYVPGYRD